MKATLSIVAAGLLLEGCLQFSISGGALETPHGAASATGSATAGASTGGTTSGSTGGASSSSTGTGTTGGPPPDAGACMGTGSNLQSVASYLKGEPLGISNSADFNGDGLLDLVAGEDNFWYLLLGLADGGVSPTVLPIGGLGSSLVAADVNGDGWPDILNPRSNGIDVLLNVGGRLAMGQALIDSPSLGSGSVLAVADLNQDGIPDIVAAFSAMNAFIGLRDGGFSAPIYLTTLPVKGQYPDAPARLFVSDLNQDGFPDIGGVAHSGQQLEVLIHQSDGGYRNAYYTFPSPIAVAPVPRAGSAPDLVVAYDSESGAAAPGVVQLLVNAGDGTFSLGPRYDVPNFAENLSVSDFNGDCLPDVAVGANGCYQENGGISVLFGDSDGGFGQLQPLPVPLGEAGPLTTLGPVSNPRALAAWALCSGGDDLTVFGDPSRH